MYRSPFESNVHNRLPPALAGDHGELRMSKGRPQL